jgi:hypothetical protein
LLCWRKALAGGKRRSGPAATLGRHPSLEAMISGTAEPDPIRHTASAEHTEAPAGVSEVVGEQGAGPRDRNPCRDDQGRRRAAGPDRTY